MSPPVPPVAGHCVPPADERFDVFLSHAHQDAKLVEALAEIIEDKEQLCVWLDRWVLIPGKHWQQDMARGLECVNACAVCIGMHNYEGWFQEEIERAINRQANDKTFRVIPLILPGGDRSCVDDFLGLRTWVDFTNGLDDPRALHDLICGIRGVRPGRFRRERANEDAEAVEIRTKLQFIRDLGDVIDKEIRIEYQKLLLDQIIKPRRF
ncbi:MAG: toll/interleukin-1 receptor domain-containing protein [Candidatus Binatia bacterium]